MTALKKVKIVFLLWLLGKGENTETKGKKAIVKVASMCLSAQMVCKNKK